VKKNEYIEQYIRTIALKHPDIFPEDIIQKGINFFINSEENIETIIEQIDESAARFIKKKVEEKIYFEGLEKKFNNTKYVNKYIENLDISNFTYDELEPLFFHYGWKKYMKSYDENGMKPAIGENSDGIDNVKSIFFSKGIEGVLELWDVWLKWRLNRQNNPQFAGSNPEEIKSTTQRFRSGNITDEEKKKWFYWRDIFINKKYLNNHNIMSKLFEYEYAEMKNSDYFIMDLKEGEEFFYDQIDMKKEKVITNAKIEAKAIDPFALTQYGHYSDFSTPIADKWNMQTIPDKDIVVEPSRLKRLKVNDKDDVFSVVKYFYDKYKKEKPKEEQIKFDVLDSYIEYVVQQKLGKPPITEELNKEEQSHKK
jgi:hypothetical protein